jgi:hypothetical protein
MSSSEYIGISSTVCWICFTALTDNTYRLPGCGHQFHLHCLLLHVHNVPHAICLVCHTIEDHAARNQQETATIGQEFRRALQTYNNSLQFYRSHDQRVHRALDVVTDSMPENMDILEHTRADCMTVRAKVLDMRDTLRHSEIRNRENEQCIADMWDIQWSVNRQHTIIKQSDAACQTHRNKVQMMTIPMATQLVEMEVATTRARQLKKEVMQAQVYNEDLSIATRRNTNTLLMLEAERLHEIDRVFSSNDRRARIVSRAGCRYCGYENGTTVDCLACITLYKTRGRQHAISALLVRVGIDCHATHLARLSPEALLVLCRRLVIA